MPIFEFKCMECGAEFEVLLKNKEETSKVTCKTCLSSRVERLMSVVHSLLGGSTSAKEGYKPRIAETHSCPTGTCTHLELPGYTK